MAEQNLKSLESNVSPLRFCKVESEAFNEATLQLERAIGSLCALEMLAYRDSLGEMSNSNLAAAINSISSQVESARELLCAPDKQRA